MGLMAKGINYHLSDSAKRKSMNNPNNEHKTKIARLVEPTSMVTQTILPPVSTQLSLPPSPEQVLAQADTTTILPSEFHSSEALVQYRTQPQQTSVRLPALPTIPTTKLPSMSLTKTKPVQLEVDALIASFEPQ